MTSLKELVIRGSLSQRELTRVEIPSLKILYVKHFYTLSLIRAPSLESLHLDDLGPSELPGTIVETFLRQVNHLRTISFRYYARSYFWFHLWIGPCDNHW
jgi:hypothetical protein